MRSRFFAFLLAPVLGAPAVAAENNPMFASWASQKPGTQTTYNITTTVIKGGEQRVTQEQWVYQLAESKPDDVVLNVQRYHLDENGAIEHPWNPSTEHVASAPTTRPADERSAHVADGAEELEVDGHKTKAHWVKTVEWKSDEPADRTVWTVDEPVEQLVGELKLKCQVQKTVTKAGSATETAWEWTCRDLPGRVVRQIVTMDSPSASRRTEMQATGVRRPGEEDTPPAVRELQQKWKAHATLHARIKTTSDIGLKDAAGHAESTGDYYRLRDSQVHVRIETTGHNQVTELGRSRAQTLKSLIVIDNGDQHSLEVIDGKSSARKLPPEIFYTGEPRAIIESFGRDFRVTREADREFEGRKAAVFEAHQILGPEERRARLLLAFDLENGCLIHFERGKGNAKPIQTFTLTDLRFDEQLDRDLFKFAAPKDVPEEEMLP